MTDAQDWNRAGDFVRHELRLAIRDHPKLGVAITFADGESWLDDLASKLIVGVRRQVDGDYKG